MIMIVMGCSEAASCCFKHFSPCLWHAIAMANSFYVAKRRVRVSVLCMTLSHRSAFVRFAHISLIQLFLRCQTLTIFHKLYTVNSLPFVPPMHIFFFCALLLGRVAYSRLCVRKILSLIVHFVGLCFRFKVCMFTGNN